MYRGLNSLRALAFLAVFAFHLNLLPVGYLGVQAFFVLSGFLLTPILIATKDTLAPRKFFINFYARRALRIFPLYYLYLFAVLLISFFIINLKNYNGVRQIDLFMVQVSWALTYTFDFFHASRFYSITELITHFWSLAVEEQFYLIWPILIFCVKRKHLKILLLTFIFLSPVLRLLTLLVIKSGEISFLGQRIDMVIYVLPFTHIDAFAIGGYFALYQTSDKSNARTLTLLCYSVLLGYLTQYIATRNLDLLSFGYNPFMREQYIWGYSLVNFVFAKIITQIKDRKFFPFLLENSLLDYLGKISYGLYVFHFSMIWLIQYTNPSWARIYVGLIAFVLTFILSASSYELIEKRFLGMKDRFFSKTLLT